MKDNLCCFGGMRLASSQSGKQRNRGTRMLSMFTKSENSLADELFGRRAPNFERRPAQVAGKHPEAGKAAPVTPPRPHGPSAGRGLLERSIPSVGQYLYHLSHDLKSFTRAETVNAVIGARPAEIQRVAKVAAKLKGRYLALVLDLGAADRGPVGDADMRNWDARGACEEAEAGLTALRSAIQRRRSGTGWGPRRRIGVAFSRASWLHRPPIRVRQAGEEVECPAPEAIPRRR
jgi:hypothetical protein